MLKLVIPEMEYMDESTYEFHKLKEVHLTLEHSLVSISKWESKWKTPFLSCKDMTVAQTIDYIKCMTITQNIDPSVYKRLTNEHVEIVSKYINDPMTATTFSDNKKESKSREIVTSELIYYWMVALQIPFECQKWHLNRLLTLVKVCNIKNAPPKKMSQREIMNRNKSLNAARRKSLGTRG